MRRQPASPARRSPPRAFRWAPSRRSAAARSATAAAAAGDVCSVDDRALPCDACRASQPTSWASRMVSSSSLRCWVAGSCAVDHFTEPAQGRPHGDAVRFACCCVGVHGGFCLGGQLAQQGRDDRQRSCRDRQAIGQPRHEHGRPGTHSNLQRAQARNRQGRDLWPSRRRHDDQRGDGAAAPTDAISRGEAKDHQDQRDGLGGAEWTCTRPAPARPASAPPNVAARRCQPAPSVALASARLTMSALMTAQCASAS